MVSKTITLTNAQGFHMRPAGVFANAMAKYKSDITIKFNGNDVNGKSLMNIIAAANDVDPLTLDKLHIECVNEVKRTNGNFVLKDAFKWQKGSKWGNKT